MKVIFVTDTMHPGGSERVISVLSNEMSKRGLDIQVVCLRGLTSFYDLDNGIKLVCAEAVKTNTSVFKKVLWLRKYINNENPDFVIPFMTPVFCLTLFSLLFTSHKIICSERIDPTKTSPIRKLMRSILLPSTTWLVVQTQQIKTYYRQSIQKKCSVIYNPVNDAFFELYNSERKKRFISVGRLAAQKNQKLMLDAFKTVHQKHPDFSLSIFGAGELKDELQTYIDKNGMREYAVLEGTSTNISKEMQSSYAFCLSSDFEGMSNAIIEAVCAGLPIVTTDVSGAQELIGGNNGGIITPVGNTEKFADAMLEIIENPERSNIMREININKREMFKTSSIVDEWLSLLNELYSKS